MEAIIRTQDRKRLIKCHNDFKIMEDVKNARFYPVICSGEELGNNNFDADLNFEYILWGCGYDGKDIELGRFKNKETAIKELDMIQSEISYYIKFKNEKIPIVEINEDYKVE